MSFIPAALNAIPAVASIFSSIYGGGRGPKETQMQKTKRNTVDEILSSLRGQGPYSDLFSPNEEAFQRSFVQPSMDRFQNQIVPMIQQRYGSQGLGQGSSIDNALTQAGVNLNSSLDSQYMNYLNSIQGRQAQFLSGIMGMGDGAAPRASPLEAGLAGLSGYASSSGFNSVLDQLRDYFKESNQTQTNAPRQQYQAPRAFDLPSYNPYQQQRQGVLY